MKKIDPNWHEWLIRRNKNLSSKLIRSAGVLKLQGAPRKTRATSVILVPKLLAAEKPENRQLIIDAIRHMEDVLIKSGARVKLDFSKVQRMFPGGTLILLAALERLIQQYPGRLQARCPPKSLAAQLLRHFGVADALGVSVNHSEPKDHSVVSWHYLTDTQAAGEKVKNLLDKYRNSIDAEIPPDLFAVLTEALTNVRQHAYTEESSVPSDLRRWWLFSRYVEPKDGVAGNLFISIYDIGVGIPQTMRNKLKANERVMQVVGTTANALSLPGGHILDKHLITEAVEHNRSQTGLAFRGKGLPEMREFIQNTEGGRLYIISGHGQYSCLADVGEGRANGCKQYFPGTLLMWSLPLKAKDAKE